MFIKVSLAPRKNLERWHTVWLSALKIVEDSEGPGLDDSCSCFLERRWKAIWHSSLSTPHLAGIDINKQWNQRIDLLKNFQWLPLLEGKDQVPLPVPMWSSHCPPTHSSVRLPSHTQPLGRQPFSFLPPFIASVYSVTDICLYICLLHYSVSFLREEIFIYSLLYFSI